MSNYSSREFPIVGLSAQAKAAASLALVHVQTRDPLAIGSYAQLSEAGRTVEDGYDWSQDALHPGERGEVLKVDRDGWVTVTGQFSAHDFMNSRHTVTENA